MSKNFQVIGVPQKLFQLIAKVSTITQWLFLFNFVQKILGHFCLQNQRNRIELKLIHFMLTFCCLQTKNSLFIESCLNLLGRKGKTFFGQNYEISGNSNCQKKDQAHQFPFFPSKGDKFSSNRGSDTLVISFARVKAEKFQRVFSCLQQLKK